MYAHSTVDTPVFVLEQVLWTHNHTRDSIHLSAGSEKKESRRCCLAQVVCFTPKGKYNYFKFQQDYNFTCSRFLGYPILSDKNSFM